MQAFDEDSGVNAALSYYLENLPPNAPFAIDRKSGWITTVKSVDREEKHLYQFLVCSSLLHFLNSHAFDRSWEGSGKVGNNVLIIDLISVLFCQMSSIFL